MSIVTQVMRGIFAGISVLILTMEKIECLFALVP